MSRAPQQPEPLERSLRRVVVTGHTGFLGSRLQRRLEDLAVEVIGVARSTGYDVVDDVLPLSRVDHVFHLAGESFVPDGWRNPVGFHRVNAQGTVRVLDQCRKADVSVTYVSTYVYGVGASMPVKETEPPRPSNPYAFSKFAGEDACRFYADCYGLRTGILRLFNVYGPGQNASFLIPTIARQVLDPAVKEIVVADLAPRRDFVHIDDVVDALLTAPRFLPGSTFNVGSGRSYSVGDVITTCLRCGGVSKPFRDRGERRINEVMDVVADVSAIREAHGWGPRVTFADGVQSVLESVRL
jgi:nucleoside-diphosphate-sugar epimerase